MTPSPCSPPSRTAHVLTVAWVIAFAGFVGACSLSRPTPVKQMFLLEPTSPPAAAARKTASVRVGVIGVAAPYRGKAFVYRKDELRFDADYYSEFFVAPSAMLTEATARTLAVSGVFRRVIAPGATDFGDYVLDGFASELYGDTRDEAKPVAAVAITFYLSPANAVTPNVIWSREYRQRAPAADATPDALARAWNAALSAILADLARDLGAANLPQ